MRYTAERYEVLYDIELEQDAELTRKDWVSRLGHRPGWKYVVKRIKSGDYIEWEGYSLWDRQNAQDAARAKKEKPSELAQANLNQTNSRKMVVRFANANFTPQDLFITLSYWGEQPTSQKDAKRDMQAYLRRIKRWRESNGLSELKYIYCVEYERDGRKTRIHHHLIMSGMDRDEAERIWGMGRANAMKLQPDEYGYEGLGRYFAKTQGSRPANERMWTRSRNLIKPTITSSSTKITGRAVERAAANEAEFRGIVQHWEPGCIINDITIRRSDYVPGVYFSVRMRKVSAPAMDRQPHPRQPAAGRPRREATG